MIQLPHYISNAYIDDLIRRSIEEDVGSGDVTTLATVPRDRKATAVVEVREPGIVAGIWMASCVFDTTDREIHCDWKVKDGASVEAGDVLGHIEGPAQSILTAERLALNFMQRMSGIATFTRWMVDLAEPHGALILDTRKTAPGLRPVDKWAVSMGGGQNHRIGLFDMILIKDNHIAAAGGIQAAVEQALHYREREGRKLSIIVEVRTLEELDDALRLEGIDTLLLDNMVRRDANGSVDASMLESAVRKVDGRFKTEASGNVSLETVEAIAKTGVHYISCGALTHSVRALDIGLNIQLGG